MQKVYTQRIEATLVVLLVSIVAFIWRRFGYKTVIASVAIFGLAVLLANHMLVASLGRLIKVRHGESAAMRTLTETRDRFTVCIQTVMSESRLSNKPIDAEKAKDICEQVEKY